MKIVNFAEKNSELNRFVAEIRDIHIQQDRLRFRKNLERIGEVMSYEISKDFRYSEKLVTTPLGTARVNTADDKIVIGTILRAGIPYHQGFLNYFDQAENAFVSAYRKYKDKLNFEIFIEYMAIPEHIRCHDHMACTGRQKFAGIFRVDTAANLQSARIRRKCQQRLPLCFRIIFGIFFVQKNHMTSGDPFFFI